MDVSSAAALISSIAAIITTTIAFRKTKDARVKNRADLEMSFASTAGELFTELTGIREKLTESEQSATEYKKLIQEAKDHEVDCRKRLSSIESILPFLLIADFIDDKGNFPKLTNVLDYCSDGIVISSPANGGAFIWVNLAFCSALKMTREEVILKGWKELVSKKSFDRTEAAEALGYSDPLLGFSNYYVDANGKLVCFKWYYTEYVRGRSFSVVKRINMDLLSETQVERDFQNEHG